MAYRVYSDPGTEALAEEPLVTVLNFSGGKQSSAILWMVREDADEYSCDSGYCFV